MSAPDTNIDTQRENHKPSLLGVKGSLIIAGVIALVMTVWAMTNDEGEKIGGAVMKEEAVQTGTVATD